MAAQWVTGHKIPRLVANAGFAGRGTQTPTTAGPETQAIPDPRSLGFPHALMGGDPQRDRSESLDREVGEERKLHPTPAPGGADLLDLWDEPDDIALVTSMWLATRSPRNLPHRPRHCD